MRNTLLCQRAFSTRNRTKKKKEIIPCYEAGEERKQTDKACEGCYLHQWRDVHPTPIAHPKTARSLGTESNWNSHRRKTATAGFNIRSRIGVRGGSEQFRSANFIIESLWC